VYAHWIQASSDESLRTFERNVTLEQMAVSRVIQNAEKRISLGGAVAAPIMVLVGSMISSRLRGSSYHEFGSDELDIIDGTLFYYWESAR
jgi:hypothetical protein